MKPRKDPYNWWVWQMVDTASSILTVPFVHTLSLFLSCYCLTTFDSRSKRKLFLRFVVVGPLLLGLTLGILPFATIGYVLWVALCSSCYSQPFIYVQASEAPSLGQCPVKVTICTSNVICIPEVLVRINNNRNVYWRVHEIAKRLLLHQNPSLNTMRNLQEPVEREDVVQSWLPDVDVIMLQEVFERARGRQLYERLSSKYPYCIYNAGQHSIRKNLCLLGSGLFIASRFPIMEASFYPFTYSTKYAKYVGYGVLLTKLQLGAKDTDGNVQQAVGYIGNIHTQAYQGKDPVIMRQLEEARNWMNSFIQRTLNPSREMMAFAVLGGDFNTDNMSPGDRPVQHLSLWDEYRDPCRVGAGRDKHWAIGTEHRQRMLHNPLVQYPETFRDVLMDDVQRRHFILDAVVEEQTYDLMRCSPKPDANGVIQATEWGGRRRIDYLTVRRDSEFSPTSVWFSTALAGLSDHLPIALMLEDL